jgi:NAD(P)-dependent dehydrogenase (short-subunit alcohol dehydrogenase family)
MSISDKLSLSPEAGLKILSVVVASGLAHWLLFRPKRIQGKQVVLITGASSGIGKITALQLIQQGHIVYGAARRVDKMEDLVKAGGHAVQMDVGDDAAVAAAVNKVITEQGKIDVLVNNAGYGAYGSVEDTPLADARRQFEVCLFGMAIATKAVLPHMKKQGSGKIINVSSMAGLCYLPLGAWYHGVKYAVEGWSDCLRLELGQFGIKVVIIEPGAIDTDFAQVMAKPLLDKSAGGPYERFAKGIIEMESDGSPPTVVSNMISSAISVVNPKTRYCGGKNTFPILFIRRYMGDYITDVVTMSLFKN